MFDRLLISTPKVCDATSFIIRRVIKKKFGYDVSIDLRKFDIVVDNNSQSALITLDADAKVNLDTLMMLKDRFD